MASFTGICPNIDARRWIWFLDMTPQRWT